MSRPERAVELYPGDMPATYSQDAAASLQLENPSPYGRAGAVVTRWAPVAKSSGLDGTHVRVSIRGDRLRAQVDPIVPGDPSRDELAFIVDRPLGAGPESYGQSCGEVSINEGTLDDRFGGKIDQLATGVKLTNNRIEVWINTAITGEAPNLKCFGGAVTNILMFRHNDRPFDLMDGIASSNRLLGYAQKRLQIDRIRLMQPAWSPEQHHDHSLHDRAWTTVAVGAGPARCWATLRSEPFDYQTLDMSEQVVRRYTCTVYRLFSLFYDEDTVHEQTWVAGVPASGGTTVDLSFRPRYFMMTDLGPVPETFRYPDHSGWFVIAAKVPPFHGFTFASNTPIGPLWIPPLDWPDRDLLLERAFHWELDATRLAHCVYRFGFGEVSSLSDAAGWMWYTRTFKPLRASLA
jgi:hypothetical protein